MRNVGFGLKVVVITNEVFHRVVREKRLEFLVELGCERLVVCQNQCGLAHILDDICHCKCLARTGHAEERLELFAVLESVRKFFNGFRLVACRPVRAFQNKFGTGARLELLQLSGQAPLGR